MKSNPITAWYENATNDTQIFIAIIKIQITEWHFVFQINVFDSLFITTQHPMYAEKIIICYLPTFQNLYTQQGVGKQTLF